MQVLNRFRLTKNETGILSRKNYWHDTACFPLFEILAWLTPRSLVLFAWIAELYSTEFRGLPGDLPFRMKVFIFLHLWGLEISLDHQISGAANGSVHWKYVFFRQIFAGWEIWKKIICPWKGIVVGRKIIQGVWGRDLMSRIADNGYFAQTSSPGWFSP